jgi:hypothetical protein
VTKLGGGVWPPLVTQHCRLTTSVHRAVRPTRELPTLGGRIGWCILGHALGGVRSPLTPQPEPHSALAASFSTPTLPPGVVRSV